MSPHRAAQPSVKRERAPFYPICLLDCSSDSAALGHMRPDDPAEAARRFHSMDRRKKSSSGLVGGQGGGGLVPNAGGRRASKSSADVTAAQQQQQQQQETATKVDAHN